MADAAVILTARKVVPKMGVEDWGHLFGLQQRELRDAIDRWRTEQYRKAGVKPPKPGQARMPAPPPRPKLTVVDGTPQGTETGQQSAPAQVNRPTPTNPGGTTLERCPYCPRRIAHGAGLAAHIRAHERRGDQRTDAPAPKPIEFPCEHCDQAFATEHGRKIHAARSHQDLAPCRHCDKSFKKAGLLAHERACQTLNG
jgi:hypothetical protein